ncbi:MAG: hypothetical protein IPJ74_25465 [Saprospiraceae bacterium]|nr:hypothetical protein [Saprospiraceae bacterium]
MNTPTGVVALALAAEPSNSSQSIGEEESLAFEVTTSKSKLYQPSDFITISKPRKAISFYCQRRLAY